MIGTHSLPAEHFEQLASGRPDEATTERVFAAEQSRLLLLSRHVLQDHVVDQPRVRRVVETLSQAQSRTPTACQTVLQDGWFGSWVSRSLASDPPPQLSRLGNIVAAAAWRSGVDATVEVAVQDGVVHLPTVGAVAVGHAVGPVVSAVIRSGELRLDVAGRMTTPIPTDLAESDWMSLRRLGLTGADRGPSFVIDDLDPLRDCFSSPPTGRLTAAEYDLWSVRARSAWSLLTRHAPSVGAMIARWVRTLVPLAPTTQDANLSISSRVALRSIALSLPPSAIDFAVTLVHEHAHAMLNGLLLFVRVDRPGAVNRYFAPWRQDPRPVLGMAHGIFAFTAVAELWRRFLAMPGERRHAQEQLARRRVELRSAVDSVLQGDELTADGRHLLAHCQKRLERLEAEPLDDDVQRRAERALNERLADWTLRVGRSAT